MSFLSHELKSKIASIALVLGAFCLHFAPAIASIAMLVLILLGLTELRKNQAEKSRWIQLALGLLLLCMLISDRYAGASWQQAFQGLQVMLPLFFLPSLLQIRWNSSDSELVILGLAIPLWWLSGATLLLYASDYQFLSQMVLESKPLPLYSSVYHIEYSMLTSVVLLILVSYLMIQPQGQNKWLLYALIVLLFLALHIMSARTGLMVFWSGISILALFFWGNSLRASRLLRRIWPVALIAPIILWYGIPSFKNRVINTKEDVQAIINKGDLNHKSFGQRVEAWRATAHVIRDKVNWFHGTGTQNFEQALLESYQEIQSSLHQSNRIGPHNQWLQWIATYGWGISMALFLAIFGSLYNVFRGKLLWLSFVPIVLASMVESIAQRQAGIMACVVLWIWIRQFQEEHKNLKKISAIN